MIWLLLAALPSLGSDTAYLRKPVSLFKYGSLKGRKSVFVENKTFLAPYAEKTINFFDHLPAFSKNKVFADSAYFRNSTFDTYMADNVSAKPTRLNCVLQFDNCRFNNLYISKAAKDIYCFNTRINTFWVESLKNCKISFSNISVNNIINISDGNNIEFEFSNPNMDADARVDIYDSKLALGKLVFTENPGMFNFVRDTIAKTFMLSSQPDADNSDKHAPKEITFEKCYIDAEFLSFEYIPRSKINFIKCSFGPNANLKELLVDSINIVDCQNALTPIPLSLNTSRPAFLRFVNSNVDAFAIELSDKTSIYFDDSTDRSNTKNSSYKNLLAKFQKENQSDNYRYVHIQYQNYSRPQIINLIDEYWWNYGYSRHLPIFWTLLLLFIFSLFNFIFWKKIHGVYPLLSKIDADSFSRFTGERFSRPGYLNVLVYTFFIFFSIHLNFSKVSFKNSFWLIIFLMQYLAGIGCLFFIVNYLFKL